MLRTRTWSRAFSTLGCVELSLDAILRLAVQHRIETIELRGFAGQLDGWSEAEAKGGKLGEMARHFAASEVEIAILATSVALASVGEKERCELEQAASRAEAIGARWIRVFDGAADGEAQAAIEGALAWWRALRRQRDWKVDLIVETHDALHTAALVTRFMARHPGLAVLWDAHNMWRKGVEEPAEVWREIKDHVAHIHVKDSVSVPSARHPFTYVLPGRGEFPMARLRDMLDSDGYAGKLSLEWERHWHPYLPPLEDALQEAHRNKWW